MALNIDLDGFGFLSDVEASKMSPTMKQQPPVSPIESESSSGISSLDSDDLKKQLLSSPTISHDDEDQQSDGAMVTTSESEKDMERSDKEGSESDASNEDEEHEHVDEHEMKEKEPQAEVELEQPIVVVAKPTRVIYGNRDILELGSNVASKQLVQYTVLPENNVNCFFQNRAQYWRLSSSERQEYSLEKCSCCDFTYPSTHPNLDHGHKAASKNANAITDSILAFLKSNEQQAATILPVQQNKRMINNSAQFGYPMSQPQPPQQYSPPNNGYFNNTNSFNANYNQQQMNPFMNNNSGYGTTLALLNLMNTASRNAANAFQVMNTNNTTPRYYNNNNNNNSLGSGYGLYKQF